MILQNSSKPLYILIKERLENDIKSGKYPVDSKLPSENSLCKQFNVSRITVRQALELLSNKGMTYSVHGKGTFVKKSAIDSNLNRINTFGETLKKMGYDGYTKIISFEEKQADDMEQMMYGKEWNSTCHLSVAGYAMNEPVVLYHSVIRNPYGKKMYETALNLESKNVPFSTFDLYGRIGVEIGKINQQVSAVNADKKLAEILQIAEGDAVLVLDSVIMDSKMKVIEYKKGYYCTNKYTFSLNREI